MFKIIYFPKKIYSNFNFQEIFKLFDLFRKMNKNKSTTYLSKRLIYTFNKIQTETGNNNMINNKVIKFYSTIQINNK